MAGPDSSIAQGLGKEALADSRRAHQQYVLVPVQELRGENGVRQPAIQSN